MEDSLEKITINIDSYNASFIDDYEFYVDIIDDIKNCIYIKTLKTEVFTDNNINKSTVGSAFKKNSPINLFRPGEYIYISLNDIHRINTVSKEIVPLTFSDLKDDEPGYVWDDAETQFYNGNDPSKENKINEVLNPHNTYVYNEGAAIKRPDGTITNYKIKDTYYNTLRYFDNIYINYEEPTTVEPTATDTPIVKVYKQELTGTSCGPNDTNTKVLNPILPELRRFNVILWRVDEFGKHVKVPIGPEEHVFRVIMSFTIYYKRKKITRV